MSRRHTELAQRIRVSLSDLDHVWGAALDAWSRLPAEPENEHAFLAAAALSAHGFYTGVERILELIARRLDGTVPTGDVWHQELLFRMRAPVPSVRPAVLDDGTSLDLDKLRRFRHVVRNVYPTDLEQDRAAEVFAVLPDLWPRLRTQLETFAAFLEAVNRGT